MVGISRRTVYRLIEQGDLKKIKVGSRTLIKRSALNRLLNNKETGKPVNDNVVSNWFAEKNDIVTIN